MRPRRHWKMQLVEHARADDVGVAKLEGVLFVFGAHGLLGKAERADARTGFSRPVEVIAESEHVFADLHSRIAGFSTMTLEGLGTAWVMFAAVFCGLTASTMFWFSFLM